MEEMHNFYFTNLFINFPDIFRWTFLLLTAKLLFNHLMWWAILCANVSLQEVFLGPIIFVGCNPDLEQKWTFYTSPIAFRPYSKPKVKHQSWLPKYHIGDKKTALDTFIWSSIQHITLFFVWMHTLYNLYVYSLKFFHMINKILLTYQNFFFLLSTF